MFGHEGIPPSDREEIPKDQGTPRRGVLGDLEDQEPTESVRRCVERRDHTQCGGEARQGSEQGWIQGQGASVNGNPQSKK